MAQPIQWATLTAREKVVARGVALRALIGGKALSCIRHHPEKLNTGSTNIQRILLLPSRTPNEFGLACSLGVSWTLQWILVLALWTSFHDVIYLLPCMKECLPLKS